MALNQVELQNLRHIIGAHEMISQKLQAYSQQATDQQVRSCFQKASQEAQSTMQELITFLK